MAFATLCDNALFPWSAIFGFNGSVSSPSPSLFGLAHDLAQVLHHLPGRGVRPLLHGRPGPAPRPVRPGDGGHQGLRGGLRHARAFRCAPPSWPSSSSRRPWPAWPGPSSAPRARWPTATDFEMFESLLILAVVAIGGVSVCTGALAGGLALGFLPNNARGRLHRGGHDHPGLLLRRRAPARLLAPPPLLGRARRAPGPGGAPGCRRPGRDPRRDPGGVAGAAGPGGGAAPPARGRPARAAPGPARL